MLSLHFPGRASASNRLEGEGEVPLAFSYQLDDAPEFERFFLVTSRRQFPVEQVLRADRALAAEPKRAKKGNLALPWGLEQWSVLLLKR